MISLEIKSLKILMNQLLTGTAFDIFLLEKADITTSVTYSIDGHINREFYPEEERTTEALPYDFKPWSDIKELCFDLIKGKNTPLNFKFVLHLKPEYAENATKKELPAADLSQLKALILIIKYDGTKAFITTGTSYHSFVLDRDIEKAWDKTISKYLSDRDISYEEL
jgi:uncharacterized protein (DUF3820 family)